MPNDIYEFRLTSLEAENKDLRQSCEDMSKKFEAFEREQAEAERKRLLAGIKAIGGLLLTTIGVLWAYRSIIFKGDL